MNSGSCLVINFRTPEGGIRSTGAAASSSAPLYPNLSPEPVYQHAPMYSQVPVTCPPVASVPVSPPQMPVAHGQYLTFGQVVAQPTQMVSQAQHMVAPAPQMVVQAPQMASPAPQMVAQAPHMVAPTMITHAPPMIAQTAPMFVNAPTRPLVHQAPSLLQAAPSTMGTVSAAGAISLYTEHAAASRPQLQQLYTNIPTNTGGPPIQSPPPPYSASTESIPLSPPSGQSEARSEIGEGLYPRLDSVEVPASSEAPRIPVLQQGTTIDFVDFVPKQTKKKGEYQIFDDLMLGVNDWLAVHHHARPLSCETMTWCTSALEKVDSDTPAYERSMVAGQTTKCLRGLRLWYVRDEEDKCRRRLFVTTFKPRKCEDLEQLVTRVNKVIAEDNSRGRFLCCEMVRYNFMSGEAYQPSQLHPERSTSKLRPEATHKVVLCLRVYRLQSGLPDVDEFLGYEDFVPEHNPSRQANGGYELLPDVMERAAEWVARQSEVRVTNTHTLTVKIKKNKGFEKQLVWTEHPCARGRSDLGSRSRETLYLTLVRVFYVVQAGATRARFRAGDPPKMTSRTFRPMGAKSLVKQRKAAVASSDGRNPVLVGFEDIFNTLERINKWISMTKARVHCIQTVPIRIGDERYEKHGPEVTYQKNSLPSHDVNHQCWLYHIRLYLDGKLKETRSSSDLLTPPLGVMEE